MLLLIAALLAAAVMSPWLLLRAGRRAFLAIALVPLAGTAWVAAQGAAVHDGETLVEVHPWVGSIGLDLAFAMGTLQWVMALIVPASVRSCWPTARGTSTTTSRASRASPACFVAFAGSMLGLVLADDLLLLYVFWELTTVFSYLLIGHDSERRASRRAAHPGARGDHVRRPRACWSGIVVVGPGRRDLPDHRDPGRPAHGCRP